MKTPAVSFNTVLFIVGLVGVWEVTHNYWALFWTVIASIHITYSTKVDHV